MLESIFVFLLYALGRDVKGMLLAEYNETEQMELFRQEGYEEAYKEGYEDGIREGLNLFAKLIQILIKANMFDDVARVAVDKEYRDHLLEKYGLICVSNPDFSSSCKRIHEA